MAPEGKSILLGTALLAILCVSLGIAFIHQAAIYLVVLGCAPHAFSLWFFRDPQRSTPLQEDVVVAPADGKIIEISDVGAQKVVSLPRDRARPLKGLRQASPLQKISIFMSPLNVHVNRIPAGGTVTEVRHERGKFSAAFKPKASLDNERQYIGISTPYGQIGCVQVAGWIARRIVCHLQEGQRVVAGERFGMIKFGSRVDLYLPPVCQIKVALGQGVRAGETIIGTFN